MLKISILMYDSILHNDTGVNSKVPLAYFPLKQEDCARGAVQKTAHGAPVENGEGQSSTRANKKQTLFFALCSPLATSSLNPVPSASSSPSSQLAWAQPLIQGAISQALAFSHES
jgi:hypothetical protein